MSLIERMQAISIQATRRLHAEEVTLRTEDGTETVLTDAIVSEVPPAVSRGEGPIDYECVLRIQSTDRAAAIAAQVAVVRNHTWNIISVGDAYAEFCRVELSRRDTDHSNVYDLAEDQGVWYDA